MHIDLVFSGIALTFLAIPVSQTIKLLKSLLFGC